MSTLIDLPNGTNESRLSLITGIVDSKDALQEHQSPTTQTRRSGSVLLANEIYAMSKLKLLNTSQVLCSAQILCRKMGKASRILLRGITSSHPRNLEGSQYIHSSKGSVCQWSIAIFLRVILEPRVNDITPFSVSTATAATVKGMVLQDHISTHWLRVIV